ncbi:MAG: carboxypeptidase regulatory-like domain-containing protein [Hymenobacter sp.]
MPLARGRSGYKTDSARHRSPQCDGPAGSRPPGYPGWQALGPAARFLVVAPQPAAAPAPPVAAVAAAPQLVSLKGLVFDANGRPRPGVCVFPTTNTHQIAVTDAQGSFQLQVPAQAALSLQAEYVGVGSSRITVNTSTAQPVHIVLGR